VAAAAALVVAAGGMVYGLDGLFPLFNTPNPNLTGLVAHSKGLATEITKLLRTESLIPKVGSQSESLLSGGHQDVVQHILNRENK
jgi:hypothetical protein